MPDMNDNSLQGVVVVGIWLGILIIESIWILLLS